MANIHEKKFHSFPEYVKPIALETLRLYFVDIEGGTRNFIYQFIGKTTKIVDSEMNHEMDYIRKKSYMDYRKNWDYTERYKAAIKNPSKKLTFPDQRYTDWYNGMAKKQWINCLYTPEGFEIIASNIDLLFAEISALQKEQIIQDLSARLDSFYQQTSLSAWIHLVKESETSYSAIIHFLAVVMTYISFMTAISWGYLLKGGSVKNDRSNSPSSFLEGLLSAAQQSFDQITAKHLIPLEKIRTFAFERSADEVFSVTIESDSEIKITINYLPTEFHPQSLCCGGLYYQYNEPVDISGFAYLSFEIRTMQGCLERLYLECKPFGFGWMHEQSIISLSKEWSRICIPIAEFINPKTAKNFGEITWAIYTNHFKLIHRLEDTIFLRNIFFQV